MSGREVPLDANEEHEISLSWTLAKEMLPWVKEKFLDEKKEKLILKDLNAAHNAVFKKYEGSGWTETELILAFHRSHWLIFFEIQMSKE